MLIIGVIALVVGIGALYVGGYYWLRCPGGQGATAPTKPKLLPVSEQALQRHVKALTSLKPARSVQHLASLNRAADYIRDQWKAIGFKVEEQTYTDDGHTFRNIMTHVGPDQGPRVVVGAHYDVCGDQPGADDNASGVAGLLELSRLLQAMQPKLKHRVDLVAYTLEEPPYFGTSKMGSAVHARALAKAGVKVKAMLALEMIGYFSNKPNSQRFPSPLLALYYPTVGNFVAVAGDQSKKGRALSQTVREWMRKASPLPVYSISAPRSLVGIDFSDHRNYWTHGFPAVMVTDTAFFRNPHYHKTTDTIDTLHFPHMANVVRGVTWAVLHLP